MREGRVILIGGGNSVKEGIENGLWDKLKNEEVWSLNFAYQFMPYPPKKQLWVDDSFFNKCVDDLEKLCKINNVEMHTKRHRRYAYLQDYIKQYDVVREKGGFKEWCLKHEPIHVFCGSLGLVGFFALSIAVSMNYKEIYLLGYDWGSPNINDKQTHWYQGNPNQPPSHGMGKPEIYLNNDGANRKISDFDVYTNISDLKIYNASLISHIYQFPKLTWTDFFNQLEAT